MAQRGLDRAALQPMIGNRGWVSEVMARKRPLTLAMIRRLQETLGLPAEVLVRPYALNRSTRRRRSAYRREGSRLWNVPEAGMQLDWNGIAYIAAIVVPVGVAGMIFWRWFDSRPHRFKDFDGNAHVWHPGGRFTDHEGKIVTDPKRIETLQKAWDDWRNPPGLWGS